MCGNSDDFSPSFFHMMQAKLGSDIIDESAGTNQVSQVTCTQHAFVLAPFPGALNSQGRINACVRARDTC